MKKLIVGLGVLGAVIALRAAAKSSGQKMSAHCKQMAGKCKQMMAGRPGEGDEATGMREHYNEMFAAHGDALERERADQSTPQFTGHEETATV